MEYQANRIRKPINSSVILFFSLFLLLFAAAGCSSGSDPATPQVDFAQSSKASDNSEIPEGKTTANLSGQLKVHFIDVGQADAILVQLPNNQVMLIDAGNNSDGSFVVDYLKNAGVKKIDYLVGSHPHEDHIGGLDTVINSFTVGKIIMPAKEHTTQTFKDVLLAIQSKGLKITKAEAGKTLLEENSLSLHILAPVETSYDDLNNYSAVIKLTFGKTSFLFTGDAKIISENEMLASGVDLKAEVLKVGHHGSSSATSQAFLDTVCHTYALISVGAANGYGHPHQKILDRLNAAAVEVYRTDTDGTIIFTSDGNNITFSQSNLGHP